MTNRRIQGTLNEQMQLPLIQLNINNNNSIPKYIIIKSIEKYRNLRYLISIFKMSFKVKYNSFLRRCKNCKPYFLR